MTDIGRADFQQQLRAGLFPFQRRERAAVFPEVTPGLWRQPMGFTE